MNSDLLELWGRWALATARGQQQVNTGGDWITSSFQMMESLSTNFLQLCGGGKPTQAASNRSTQQPMQREEGIQDALEPFLQMQERLWGYQSPAKLQELEKKIMELEHLVAVQGCNLELLKSRLEYGDMPERSKHFTDQFHELIERQNQQFQHLTSSFTEYFKDMSKKTDNHND